MKKLLLFTLLCSQFAHAEYRVYQYIVKNKIKTASDQPNSHIQTSSLNPVAFIAYNGGSRIVNVDLLRTWVCPGNTSHGKKICNNPYGAVPKELL